MARQIKAEIVGDASSYKRATKEAVEHTHKFGSVLQGMAMGAGIAAFNVVAEFARQIPEAIGSSITAASDLNETVSKVEVVFGAASGSVMAFGANAAAAMGMSRQEALAAAGTFGNLFVSMGLNVDKSSEMSRRMVQLAGDLASFNNIDPGIALEKLRAGLTGESEPLKSLGVNLNEASIKAEAMRLHLYKGKGEISASAKAQAAYSLILKQTATAQGDFERTSSGLANQQRILAANQKDLSASLGKFLLPLQIKLTGAFIQLSQVIQQRLVPFIQDHLIPAFMQVWAAAQQIWQAFMGLLAPALDYIKANFESLKPILIALAVTVGIVVGLIILAILAVIAIVVGLVAAFIWLKQKHAQIFDGIRNKFGELVGWVAGLPGRISSAAKGMWDGIWNAFKAMLNFIVRAWNSLKFTIPAFDFLGQHTPSVSLAVPQIPSFQQGTGPGGLPYTGLFYGHKGEAVTPAGRGGGEIHIHMHGMVIDGPAMDRFFRIGLQRARFASGL